MNQTFKFWFHSLIVTMQLGFEVVLLKPTFFVNETCITSSILDTMISVIIRKGRTQQLTNLAAVLVVEMH